MNPLDDILNRLAALPAEVQKEIVETAMTATADAKFVPNPGPQTDAWFSQADELFYGGQAGGGKLLDENTPVPVTLDTDPSGFKRHGDLKPGDYVYGPDGKPTLVIWRHPTELKPDAYEVEFSTGETIVADARHRWLTWDYRERDRLLRSSEEWRAKRKASRPSRAKQASKKPWASSSITAINKARQHEIALPAGSIRTTRDILETLTVRGGRLNHSVEVMQPLAGNHFDLPVDPYLFGLWLGDGFTRGAKIIMMSADWADIEKHLPAPSRIVTEGLAKNRKQEVQIRTFEDLKRRACGKSKRIPPLYLRASEEQRRELLRGMLDTDGTCDARGQIELGFSNKDLAHDALQLINSLGIKCAIRVKKMASEAHADHYRMKFIADFDAFKLRRKLQRQKHAERKTCGRRYITDVRPCEPRPMNCITVVGGLYCVGETFITTHNSALGCGLAYEAHERSLILRRYNKDAKKLADAEFIGKIRDGDRDGWNGSDLVYRDDRRHITFGGCEMEQDKQRYKGDPHDLIVFDEVTDFLESQYVFITIWNRSATQGQRCRVVCTGNPPTTAEGLWVIKRWAPWLDPKHHNPAKPGELRWFLSDEDGNDLEVDGQGPHLIGGKEVYAKSRTFIPAKLSDNPDLSADGQYERVLDALPKELREAYRDGRFDAGLKDHPWQLIPTQWVIEAQARWKPMPPAGIPMCAIAADVAQGGADNNVIAARYDSWFAELQIVPGSETPLGKDISGEIVKHRRDGALIIIDCGGGYGGSAYKHFHDNNDPVVAYKGATTSSARTKDGTLSFANKRTECLWRFREALDPSQLGGSQIALPPDPVLLSDLTAVHYEVRKNVIHAEPKEEVAKRIGRSPDRGDAVVMCYTEGARMATHHKQWSGGNRPTVNVGHAKARRRR